MTAFTESVIEEAALAWFESVGWRVRNGPGIAPGEPAAERDDYGQVVLAQLLRDALAQLNLALPADALEDAFRKLTRLGLDSAGAELIVRNRALHRLLVDGVMVEYRNADGSIRRAGAGDRLRRPDGQRLVGAEPVQRGRGAPRNVGRGSAEMGSAGDGMPATAHEAPASRSAVASPQGGPLLRPSRSQHSRRPAAMLFVNGLSLAALELKNAAAENASIWSAFQQLQTYQAEVLVLFGPNALLAVSAGVEARVGTLGAGREWFKPWRTIAGDTLAGVHVAGLWKAWL